MRTTQSVQGALQARSRRCRIQLGSRRRERGDGLNRFSKTPFETLTRVPWANCHNSSADCLAFKGFSVARTTLAGDVTVDVYNLRMEAGDDPQDDQLPTKA
ncbi:MAG: hypothetical protein ACE5E4_02820 [Candidatus Binatia bacterium]